MPWCSLDHDTAYLPGYAEEAAECRNVYRSGESKRMAIVLAIVLEQPRTGMASGHCADDNTKPCR